MNMMETMKMANEIQCPTCGCPGHQLTVPSPSAQCHDVRAHKKISCHIIFGKRNRTPPSKQKCSQATKSPRSTHSVIVKRPDGMRFEVKK